MAEQRLAFEIDIIRQAQNGSQDAYRRLYERYTDAIYRYIYKRVGESRDAEDLTQAVFVKAWQALRDYQLTGAPFQAWLYRIAHNAVIDHYRTRSDPLLWEDLAGMADPQNTPESGLLRAEQQAVVHNALAELRPAYREVLVRRFLYNMDYAETAAELGQQVNNIRVLQHRALDALRRVLSSQNALRLSSVVAALCLLLGGKLVVAAEQALPGDRLYPVRAVVEDVRLFLADDTGDLRLHTDFATQRVAALADLYQQQRMTDVATAVNDIAEHLHAATATLHALTQAAPTNQPEVEAEFDTALEKQFATLNGLSASTAPEWQATLRPAINAVRAAQEGLELFGVDPATPSAEPTPTAPATQPPATPTPLPTPPPPAVATPVTTIHAAPVAEPQLQDQPTSAAQPATQPDAPQGDPAVGQAGITPPTARRNLSARQAGGIEPAAAPSGNPTATAARPVHQPAVDAVTASSAPTADRPAAADQPERQPPTGRAEGGDEQQRPAQPPGVSPQAQDGAAHSPEQAGEAPPADAAQSQQPDKTEDRSAPEAPRRDQLEAPETTDKREDDDKPADRQSDHPNDAGAKPNDQGNRRGG